MVARVRNVIYQPKRTKASANKQIGVDGIIATLVSFGICRSGEVQRADRVFLALLSATLVLVGFSPCGGTLLSEGN